MSTLSKPSIKYQVPDWFTNSFAITANSERQRDASHQIRQNARALRLAADLRTKWDEYHNTTRLADRVNTLTKNKNILELVCEQLDQELIMINMGKNALEELMQNMQNNIKCSTKCLVLRDTRRRIDFVNDAVEYQLNQQKIDEVFEQMILLKEARKQVILDLQNKNKAIDIDNEQYKLTPSCQGVSLKPNPTRILKGTTTVEQWENFTQYNWQRAQAELQSGQRLREVIFQTISQISNDIEAQAQATDFVLRRRKHETKQALNELNWQKTQTEDEISELEKDIIELENRMHQMIPAGKLAQTRLERRTYRPGVDLCRDSAQYGLTDEVRQIEVTFAALEEKHRQARHALDALHKQLNRIIDDIELKQNSLNIETNCLNTRKSFLKRPSLVEDNSENQFCENENKLEHTPTFIDPVTAQTLLA